MLFRSNSDFFEGVLGHVFLRDDVVEVVQEAAKPVIDGLEVQLLLRAESLVDGAVAEAELLIEGPHRHALVAVDGEDAQRRVEDGSIIVDLRAAPPLLVRRHVSRLAAHDLLTNDNHVATIRR